MVTTSSDTSSSVGAAARANVSRPGPSSLQVSPAATRGSGREGQGGTGAARRSAGGEIESEERLVVRAAGGAESRALRPVVDEAARVEETQRVVRRRRHDDARVGEIRRAPQFGGHRIDERAAVAAS